MVKQDRVSVICVRGAGLRESCIQPHWQDNRRQQESLGGFHKCRVQFRRYGIGRKYIGLLKGGSGVPDLLSHISALSASLPVIERVVFTGFLWTQLIFLGVSTLTTG
jgi:hypothetical protein